MAKRELTHLYHQYIQNGQIAIGDFQITNEEKITLFEKSLVLTSDLKRLPYLLGGRLLIGLHANVATNIIASVINAITFDLVLLNGDYDAADFNEAEDVITDDKAKDDILLMAHGYIHALAGDTPTVDIQQSAWDFEGQKILYDTLTLLGFSYANANIGTAAFGPKNLKGFMEIEVDWKPLNKAEMMEFLMEHIYAKQGD